MAEDREEAVEGAAARDREWGSNEEIPDDEADDAAEDGAKLDKDEATVQMWKSEIN